MALDHVSIAIRKKRMERNTHWHNALAFHFFPLNSIKWREWFYYFEDYCASIGVTFNKSLLSGKFYKYGVRYQSYKGTKKKLEAADFANVEGINNLSFLYPDNKDNNDAGCVINMQSGYDSENRINPIDEINEAYSYFIIEENKLPFNLEEYLNIAKHYYEFTGFAYGYFFRYPAEGMTELYVMGKDGISITDEEVDRVEKWSDFRMQGWPWKRDYEHKYKIQGLIALRDIFKLNFLSREHLDLNVGGITLERWIRADKSRGVLDLLCEKSDGQTNRQMYYWYIDKDDERLAELRNELKVYGFIVCV